MFRGCAWGGFSFGWRDGVAVDRLVPGRRMFRGHLKFPQPRLVRGSASAGWATRGASARVRPAYVPRLGVAGVQPWPVHRTAEHRLVPDRHKCRGRRKFRGRAGWGFGLRPGPPDCGASARVRPAHVPRPRWAGVQLRLVGRGCGRSARARLAYVPRPRWAGAQFRPVGRPAEHRLAPGRRMFRSRRKSRSRAQCGYSSGWSGDLRSIGLRQAGVCSAVGRGGGSVLAGPPDCGASARVRPAYVPRPV